MALDKINALSNALDKAKDLGSVLDIYAILNFQFILPQLSFDWTRKDGNFMEHGDLSVSLNTVSGENSYRKEIKPIAKIPVQLTEKGNGLLSVVNKLLQRAEADSVFETLYHRPSTIAYLASMDADIQTLTIFRRAVIDILQLFTEKSVLLNLAQEAINRSFRQRIFQTASAYVMAMNHHISDVRDLINSIDPNYVKEVEASGKGFYYNNELENYQSGPFPWPANDGVRVDQLWSVIRNALTLLGTIWPKTIDRLSQNGCSYIPGLVRALGEFHNDYFIYLGAVAMDTRFSQSNHLDKLFNMLEYLNKVNYRTESPAQFLSETLPQWREVCKSQVTEIDKELSAFKKITK